MATKAVHLELVSDLSTQAFLAALKRLTARRGAPRNMYSDNGTNFVGADRELRKQFRENKTFSSEVFNRRTTEMEIQWHFNAPAWPSAGGLWERAVRSIKGHMKNTIGLQKLTFEEFTTLLCQIEACLNSRPLITLTEDPDDLEYGVLTPGHFLIGEPLTTIPEPDLTNEVSFKTRWQLVTRMKQDFWRKWSRDYLQELQKRTKWHQVKENITIGDVVLIKDENLPPGKWAMGKVIDVHPGSDGLVRVVTLKTQKTNIKRPVTKIIKLPVEQQESDNNKPEQNEKKKPRMRTKNTIGYYLCMFLSFMSMITGTFQQNITQFEKDRPIYYDEMGQLQTVRGNWKVVAYYNMTTYWTGIRNIEGYVEHVEGLCKRLTYQLLCESIVTELKQETKQIQHNNYLLNEHNKNRIKRGFFNGIGQLAHSLFGVLDEDFATQYQQDIEKVQNNEQHLLNLIKNQTSLVEAQNNILQRNEESMNKQFQLLDEHIKNAEISIGNLEKQTQENAFMTYFNAMAFSTNIVLTKLRLIQESILSSITNIHEGRVYSNLITQEQLLQQLSIISTQLPAHLSLPVDNIRTDLLDVYKLLHVKARISSNYFIFEVKVPLLDANQYRLYSVIPLPLIKNSNTIQVIPTYKYIAINMLNDVYLGVEQSDLQSCVVLKQSKYLCTFNKPINSMRQDKIPCEISFLIANNNKVGNCDSKKDRCTSKWIELHRHNTWLFVCCQECEVRIICRERIIAKTAYGSGTITVGQGCSIKKENTIIQTDNTYQRKIYIDPQVLIPVMDDINNITRLTNISLLEPVIENHRESLTYIKQQLDKLKEQSELPKTISEHDIHQYAVSYVALIAFLTLLITGIAYLYCKQRKSVAISNKRVEEIEMTSIRRPKPVYAIPNRRFNIE